MMQSDNQGVKIMGMPRDLLLIRHGESEANVMQHLVKHGETHPMMEQVYARPDWMQRLSLAGIEQAREAGRWIERELGGLATFDLRLRSPFMRTRETSLYLANPNLDITDENCVRLADVEWENDDRLVERHWGMFGTLTVEQQKAIYPHTERLKKIDPLYTALDGGESIMSGVRNRVRDEHGRYHREADGLRVACTTHGEYIWTERLVNEYMLPEEWVALDGDKSQRVRNCAILHYSRMNPFDLQAPMDEHMRWMRFIYTDAPEESPYGGEWQEIQRKRRFTAAQTLAQLALAPPLLRDIETKQPVEPWEPPHEA